jgi:3-oxoacyl-[acyl-carrier-protein] synthase III
MVHRLLAKAGWTLEQVDHLFFTQINKSVITQVMDALGLPFEKTTCVMDRYGYTGSACIPMALHTALGEGRVKKGDADHAMAGRVQKENGGHRYRRVADCKRQ